MDTDRGKRWLQAYFCQQWFISCQTVTETSTPVHHLIEGVHGGTWRGAWEPTLVLSGRPPRAARDPSLNLWHFHDEDDDWDIYGDDDGTYCHGDPLLGRARWYASIIRVFKNFLSILISDETCDEVIPKGKRPRRQRCVAWVGAISLLRWLILRSWRDIRLCETLLGWL